LELRRAYAEGAEPYSGTSLNGNQYSPIMRILLTPSS
jgi:hypothetical protein